MTGAPRRSTVNRVTRETDVTVSLSLDGSGSADVETALERSLHDGIMRGDAKPVITSIDEGETLVRQGESGTDIFLILDGIFVVEVDDEPVAEIGPGAVVGERASQAGGGKRTATLRARSAGRVASVPAGALDPEALGTLSASRDRE